MKLTDEKIEALSTDTMDKFEFARNIEHAVESELAQVSEPAHTDHGRSYDHTCPACQSEQASEPVCPVPSCDECHERAACTAEEKLFATPQPAARYFKVLDASGIAFGRIKNGMVLEYIRDEPELHSVLLKQPAPLAGTVTIDYDHVEEVLPPVAPCPRCVESDIRNVKNLNIIREQKGMLLYRADLLDEMQEWCADQKFKLAEYDRAFVEQEQQIASDKLLLDECEEVATGVIEAWDGISYAFRKNKYNGLKELLTKLKNRKGGA